MTGHRLLAGGHLIGVLGKDEHCPECDAIRRLEAEVERLNDNLDAAVTVMKAVQSEVRP